MKNFQMLSTTTYSDIEEYFRSALYDEVWKRDSPKETITFVYTVGEYGAMLFSKCITDFSEDFNINIQSNSLSLKEPTQFEKQFVKYDLPNGFSLKLEIEEKKYLENIEREEVSGFPLESMLLKFKAIVNSSLE